MAPRSADPKTFALGLALSMTTACAAPPALRPAGTVRYEGSSTVALFLEAAEPVYGAVHFEIDTRTESNGGEEAIVAGSVDLAGIARKPGAVSNDTAIAATLIGRDAIAVIVNAKNPVTNLSRAQLRRIFAGQVESWLELGGPDVPVLPFIVGPGSATRDVFRRRILEEADYAGCEEVSPDEEIVTTVADAPGAIGQISFSFLRQGDGVRAVAVDGERPSVTNFDYPIYRPLSPAIPRVARGGPRRAHRNLRLRRRRHPLLMIRATTSRGEVVEFLVTIEAGKVTELDITKLLEARG